MNSQSFRPRGFEDIVYEYENKLLRIALAILKNRADAEDVVQDVFVKLHEKSPAFESAEHEAAWLVRVAVNMCKSRLRSAWLKRIIPLEWDTAGDVFDDYSAENDLQKEVVEAVQSLPLKYRIVVHLFYYEGYSTREIAEITEQKESTVRQHLTRARRQLKGFLEGEFA